MTDFYFFEGNNMIDIKVLENGIYYPCSVEEKDIYMYINENEDNMNCLDDKQKILKAIYEMWAEGECCLCCGDIPENSPHYREEWHYIENISPNDIVWNDDNTPSDILNRVKIKLKCIRALEETLGIDHIYIGVDLGENFYIGIGNNTSLYFHKDLSFKDGSFYGKYRIKKNRTAIIERVQNAIHGNINLIKDFYSTLYY